VISALFGFFQGGIVPAYAIIVREYFAPREAGVRLGAVLMATLGGMALGGWMSGAIFDLSGSYRAAFVNASRGTCLISRSYCGCCGGRVGGSRRRNQPIPTERIGTA
jgi:MFS family permease